MAAPADLPPEERLRRRRWQILGLVLLASLALHALVAWLAGRWTIVHGVPRRGVPILIARRAAEPASAPVGGEGAPAEAAIPIPTVAAAAEMPVPVPAMASPALVAPAVPAPAPSRAGAEGGRGAAEGEGSGGGTGLSLFGLDGDARRVVIAIDVSRSMYVRAPRALPQIIAEAFAALDRLDGRTAFDLLVFEDGSLAWRPALVPATVANRAEARRWLEGIAALGERFGVRGGKGTVLFEGGGTRGDTLLRQAFSLAPDWILVVTDGEWNAVDPTGKVRVLGTAEVTALAGTLQGGRRSPARIDVVFQVTPRTRPGESASARALAEENGGRLVEFRPEPGR
jgi:hypothetical protein